MSKRHKRGRAGRSKAGLAGFGPEEWRGHVETLIARGKTREAVEAAKQLLKQEPDPETEALLMAAYQARIQALMAGGMHKEARTLSALVGERFPAYKAQVAPLMLQSEVVAGDFHALLTELSTADAPRRHELEALLTRELHDPLVLADSPVLPPDHPLKRAARTVCDQIAR